MKILRTRVAPIIAAASLVTISSTAPVSAIDQYKSPVQYQINAVSDSWSERKKATVPASFDLANFTKEIIRKADRSIRSNSSFFKALVSSQKPAERGEIGIDPIITGTVTGSFFGTVALPFSSVGTKSRWNKVRNASLDDIDEICSHAECKSRFAHLTDATRKHTSFAQLLKNINIAVNSVIDYQTDRLTYKKLDYWAAGSETINRGRGDCEDFAILKHALLIKAGIPSKSLSLVILKDKSRGLYHAVLAVSTNKGHFILDNLNDEVYRDTRALHYQPLYSLSEDRSWIHGIPGGKKQHFAGLPKSLSRLAPGEGFSSFIGVTAFSDWTTKNLRPTIRF